MDKIRTHCISIAARTVDGKPYYGIQWVDEEKMELREGYNSFDYSIVLSFAKLYFDIIPNIDKYN